MAGPARLRGAEGGAMMRLHHVQYGRSFRVLWLYEEIGEAVLGPLEIVEHRIGSKEMRESDLPRLSPAVRIPAIELDGLEMSESGAIVQHLCETCAPALDRTGWRCGAARLPAVDPFRRDAGQSCREPQPADGLPAPPAKPSPVVVKLTVARLRQTVAGMEARLGAGYLLPSGFSGADVMMGFNLFAIPYFVDLAPFPKVRAYKALLETRAAHRRACAREGAQRFYTQDFYPVPEA
ncbi:glutathione S-transferase family protein [Ponticoccus litoralis]|uniref:Glutathione S-transferase n=1 Tax=Ponticoccus litoralis TaxID=422297 RepID=A0AAW9SRW5_9RHOB